MQVYVSGLSAVGKSSFTQQMSKKFNLKYLKEVIRSNDLNSMTFEERQRKFFKEYVRIHQLKDSFICDRTFIDIVVWSEEMFPDDYLLKIVKTLRVPDLIIIPPVPPYSFFVNRIDSWLNDPVRLKTYSDKFKQSFDINNKKDRERFLLLLMDDFYNEITKIEEYYQLIGWPYQRVEPNYFSWQDVASNLIQNFPDDSKKNFQKPTNPTPRRKSGDRKKVDR